MIISYLKQRGVNIEFAVNCSLFKHKIIKKVLELEVNLITFSLDTLNRETYKKIRGVDLFNEVKKNIENFVKIHKSKSKYKNTKLRINMVLNDDNYYEIINIIEYAKKIGVYELILTTPQPKYNIKQQNYIKKSIKKFQKIKSFDSNYESAIIKKAEILRIKLGFNKLNPSNAINCQWNFNTTYITWDGFLTPCCHLENPLKYNFGNIIKIPFKKIWNHKEFRDFRINHLNIKGVCKDCPHLLMFH